MANLEQLGVDTHINIPLDRIATPQQISSYIKKLIKASMYLYHESEAVVVSKVYLNDPDNYAAIKGNFLISKSEVDNVIPLMPHITDIPLNGEHVLVTEYNGKHFYLSQINRKNSPTENSIPIDLPENTKFGETFEKKDIRRVEVCEGEIVYEGRFGNSIKLGCDHTNNTPVIKIRAGQTLDSETRKVTGKPVKENIDKDASSIYLISDGLSGTQFDEQQIKGKKILIKSDGIFIKGSDIRIGSGNTNKLQPVVRGDDLKQFLDDLLSDLDLHFTNAMASILTAAPAGGAIASPIFKTGIQAIKTKLASNKMLSDKVKTT